MSGNVVAVVRQIVIATFFVVGLIAFSALSHAAIAPLAYLGITALGGKSSRRPSLVIGSRSTHSSFSSPSHAGPGCGDRLARSWACPFSCARWWRCVVCHRQAARTPAYTRLLRMAKRSDAASSRCSVLTCIAAKAGRSCPEWVIFNRGNRAWQAG
jgi:hypothetical protein